MYGGIEENLRAVETANVDTEPAKLLTLAKLLARTVRAQREQVQAYAGVITALDESGEMLERLDGKWTP